MKQLIKSGLIGGTIFFANFLHAQDSDTNVDWSQASDLAVELQALEETTPVPAAELPDSGTFYSAQHSPVSLQPWPPLPIGFLNAPAWPLGGNVFILDDLDYRYNTASAQTQARNQMVGGMQAMDEGGGFSPDLSLDTNGLFLKILSVTNGLASLALMNGTDFVYAIWGTTNLATPVAEWQVIAELWPTNGTTNTLPFTVNAGDDANLFLVAQDWAGVTANGNQTPLWWFYYYYGEAGLSLLDDDLDSQEANTLLTDFQLGLDPNVISFMLTVTNNYVNNMSAPLQVNVTAGAPSYYAVLVDSTNFAGATWNAYASSNITANLGLDTGWHDVWVGLRGLPSNATQTWQWKHFNLLAPPLLVITNPATYTVDEPMIQIYGYCQDSLANINYDISNAVGVATNQPSEITDRYYDTNVGDFTTNYFECLDVPLTNGLNAIIIHATDLAGDITTTNFNFTLDYSGKTNPPAVQITWPTNGTQISGSNFTCRGWISDPTATVTTQLIFTNSDTNLFYGGIYTNTYVASVERNGNFWLENLPLNTGTNAFTLTVTDAANNVTTTNISVIQSALVLTVNPVTPDSQLWQPTVNLTGTISDATYAVWVNGVKGHNNGDGTWSANNVPVNSGGTASFTATAYAPIEQQPDGSYGN